MTLYLLPNFLSDEQRSDDLPSTLKELIPVLDGFIVENEKEARKYLKHYLTGDQIRALSMHTLNKQTKDLIPLIEGLLRGQKWGLISDCGLPGIADPGAALVFLARQKGVDIKTIAGPCSIVMSLQLSGFCGQRFTFHGYLPQKEIERKNMLQELEKKSCANGTTQIFIETPFRNDRMLEAAIKSLKDSTYLCVVKNLESKDEQVFSFPVETWKNKNIELGKCPCVFLVYAKS